MTPANVPISLYKPAIINTSKTRRQSQSAGHSKDIKSHLNLFSQLHTSYTSTQIRKGGLTAFFSHDPLKYSSSVSKYVKIWLGNKSNLLSSWRKKNTFIRLFICRANRCKDAGSKILQGSVTQPNQNETLQ